MNENFLHHLESLTGVVTQYGLDLVAGIAILFLVGGSQDVSVTSRFEV